LHEDPDIKKELREAAETAEEVTNSRPLELMARAGFAVSGILHFLMGSIAIRLAMGGRGQGAGFRRLRGDSVLVCRRSGAGQQRVHE
jgi:hypothetical protein